eukprot:CAMPEP_0206263426 /NCGR_PEP_ID=MMETSP0047_2-20121206/28812_1 /ASSEMBLY_ACC=CAM_ASM_000192 /TAXON_ID=195065 /ORGANISM="Chroomonas mesostigmatica_cf, Strain CCMP1168" /LENGTH=30 /DNA_ID= /DNA_START= /DNA_END= /DNA_ORIENTATION=
MAQSFLAKNKSSEVLVGTPRALSGHVAGHV